MTSSFEFFGIFFELSGSNCIRLHTFKVVIVPLKKVFSALGTLVIEQRGRVLEQRERVSAQNNLVERQGVYD